MPIRKSMKPPPELLQFLGSLLAIFALAGLAWWMRLGGTPRLTNENDARIAADEAMDGFTPTAIGIDAKGRGAILRDAEGRTLVLKAHGNKLAGRLLTTDSSATADNKDLAIETGESRFGSVTLQIEDAQAWADRVNALKQARDA